MAQQRNWPPQARSSCTSRHGCAPCWASRSSTALRRSSGGTSCRACLPSLRSRCALVHRTTAQSVRWLRLTSRVLSMHCVHVMLKV